MYSFINLFIYLVIYIHLFSLVIKLYSINSIQYTQYTSVTPDVVSLSQL